MNLIIDINKLLRNGFEISEADLSFDGKKLVLKGKLTHFDSGFLTQDAKSAMEGFMSLGESDKIADKLRQTVENELAKKILLT